MNISTSDRRPILSICIPTYNRVGYLKQALGSLIPQLTDEVEIVVSDNHSPGSETWDYLGSLEGKVKRVKPPPKTGANFNILSCATLGSGVYSWIHCDDDIARLNAVENILRAIKEFNYPPALTFDWDGFDVNMTGFTNSQVTARWKRCDRNEFLRTISFKFTFASAVIVKKECVDVEYIKTHSPVDLIPANIMLSTVGKYNDAVVALDPLLAARGNPGKFDALTIFSKDYFALFRLNEGLGYDPLAVKAVYSESLKTVIIHGIKLFPIHGKSLWNITRYSFGYKNFYTWVVPALARRYTRQMAAAPRQMAKNRLKRMLLRGVRLAARFGGAELYDAVQAAGDTMANDNFAQRVRALGVGGRVRHPIYLVHPEYFQIGSDFCAQPGLRLEAWDEFAGEKFRPVIKIGNRVGFNWNVHVGAIDRVEIGDDVLVGSNVLITDHAHGCLDERDCRVPPSLRPLTSKGPVVIEDNVWIGENVCVLPGVRIGHGAVIAANAAVTSDVPANSVVGGVPARVIKYLDAPAGTGRLVARE